MTRIQLTIYSDPDEVEAFINIRRSDITYERVAAAVDTGAEMCLFDAKLLDVIEYRLHRKISVTQAGIARQSFEGIEAYIYVFLEDAIGTRTKEFEILAMFAETEVNLLGFEDLLVRATLYIDMRQTKTGWLEFDD
jgi:hypothetical protein